MSKIIKNYLYNTAYQILVLLVPLVTAPYLARVLGAEQLGVYGYVSSISSIFVTVGLLGIYSYGNRETAYIRDDKTKLSETFWGIVTIQLILCFFTSIIFFLFMTRSGYSQYFKIYFIWLLASFLDVSWIFVGLENMKPAVIKNTFSKLLTIIGIFLLVKDDKDLWIYLLLISSSTMIANVSVYPILKFYVNKPSFHYMQPSKLVKHLRESMYLLLPQIATVFYLQIDKVMIEEITGITRDVGYYLQAEKIINIPLALITGLSTVMMPRIANEFKKRNVENINAYLMQAAQFTMMIATPMSVGIAIISPGFVSWFLGNEFTPTSSAVIILSPLLITNALGGISGNQYFTATNQVNLLIRTHVLASFINIGLNLILIPRLNFLGAAYASVIASSVSVLLQYYYMSKQIPIVIVSKSLIKYFLISIVMGLFIKLIGFIEIFSTYLFLVQIFSGIFVYLAILIISKDKLLTRVVSLIKCK